MVRENALLTGDTAGVSASNIPSRRALPRSNRVTAARNVVVDHPRDSRSGRKRISGLRRFGVHWIADRLGVGERLLKRRWVGLVRGLPQSIHRGRVLCQAMLMLAGGPRIVHRYRIVGSPGAPVR